MSITNDEKAIIMNLIASCNELIEGKFILADSKISKILKNITDSKEVYNLLSECMVNFNFEKEFIRAKIKLPTKPGYFKMPEEKYKILPMVFCLLVDIEKRKIDFPQFLRDYFSVENGKISEFENFANEVIKPFRNAISDSFELPLIIDGRGQKNSKLIKNEESGEENMKELIINEVSSEPVATQAKENEEIHIFKDLIKIVNEIIATVQYDYHIKEETKDNAIIILNGIVRACELEDFKLLNALLIGFDFISSSIKSIRFIYKELKDTLSNFYASL